MRSPPRVAFVAANRKDLLYPSNLTDALQQDLAVFVNSCPESVHDFGSFADKSSASTKEDCWALLPGTLGFDETHFRLPGCGHDGLRIGRIILCRLANGFPLGPISFTGNLDQIIILQVS